jgi:hypothetical protein
VGRSRQAYQLTAAAVAVALALAASPAAALTGAEWRRLPPAARDAYVLGIVEAWNGVVMVQESLGGRDSGITVFAGIVTCLRERLLSPARIAAAVDSYVRDNPGLSGKEMPDVVFAVLTAECR